MGWKSENEKRALRCSGVVTDVVIDRGPFHGDLGTCIITRFRRATIASFDGGALTVRKNFHIE